MIKCKHCGKEIRRCCEIVQHRERYAHKDSGNSFCEKRIISNTVAEPAEEVE